VFWFLSSIDYYYVWEGSESLIHGTAGWLWRFGRDGSSFLFILYDLCLYYTRSGLINAPGSVSRVSFHYSK
jgi:hypothetical protein